MADTTDQNQQDSPHRRREQARSGGLRHAVELPARIDWRSGGGIDAEICDISSIGMYLRHHLLEAKHSRDVLGPGSTVTVTFVPDREAAPDTTVSLSAQVMRSHPHGIGVQFLQTTAAQRHALRMLALTAVRSRASSVAEDLDTEQAPRQGHSDIRGVMIACRKVIERKLGNIVWTLSSEVAKKLLLVGSNANTQEDKSKARSEAELIQQKSTAIGRTIERRVIGTFAEMGGLVETLELVLSPAQRARIAAASSGKKLDLMEEKTISDSVVMETVARRVHTKLVRKSFFTNVRLANVLGRRIDNIENPLAPAVMACMLWESLTQYCESPRVHAALSSTLLDRITPLLGELYEELEQTLDELDVAPAFGANDPRKY